MAENTNPETTMKPVLTKIGDVDTVAAYMAWHYLFKRCGIPSSKQMGLYRRPDDQYFCAVSGCEVCGPSQRGNKTMVTMGPIVLCHSHARDVLIELKDKLGQQLDPVEQGKTPPRWFHPLNKTLFVIERREDEWDEEGLKFWNEKTDKEMSERAKHLAEALAWAPGHREWFARETERKADRVESERQANLPPAPEVNPYAGKTIGQLKKDEDKVKKALALVESIKGSMTETGYTQAKAMYEKIAAQIDEAMTSVEQEAERKVKEKQSADTLKAFAKLNKALGLGGGAVMTASGIRVELCSPPSGGSKPTATKPTTTTRQTVGTAKGGTPAQFPCNYCQQLTGSPNERLGDIPVFVAKQVTTADQAFSLLGETSPRYRELLRMHASDRTTDKELADNKNPKREEAKRMAKECDLHKAEFKKLGQFRYAVICHIKVKWPELWQDRGSSTENGNGDDGEKPTFSFTCECRNGVNKLFPKPIGVEEVKETVKKKGEDVPVYKTVFTYEGEPSVCGECLKRLKAQLDRPIRDARDARKVAADIQRRKDTKGPTGEQTGKKGGKKGGDKGGKKGGKKGKH